MEENKSWWQSKTVWGGIIAFVAGIAGAFGIDIPGTEQAAISEAVYAVAVGVGSLLAVYGRLKANRKIGK